VSGDGIHGALSRAAEEARVRWAQRRDWGREQWTDAWGAGAMHVSSKWAMGWVNGPAR
jgi:hypothetical protein